MRKHIRSGVLGAVLALALIAAACSPGGDTGTETEGMKTITVGVSAAFTENVLVAEMYAQVLEAAGYEVKREFELGSREISQPALEDGEIDVKPEYGATLLSHYDENATDLGDADSVAEALGPLAEEAGVTALKFSDAVDTNAIVVTGEFAAENRVESVSDLAPLASNLTFGGPPECPDRPFCIPGLKDTYGIEFGEFKPLDSGGPLTLAALTGGEIDVGLLFSTDPAIVANGLVLLKDDKKLQSADNIVPVVRTEILDDEIEDLLNGVSAELTTEGITELIDRIDNGDEDTADVASDFLSEVGLI